MDIRDAPVAAVAAMAPPDAATNRVDVATATLLTQVVLDLPPTFILSPLLVSSGVLASRGTSKPLCSWIFTGHYMAHWSSAQAEAPFLI